VAGHLSPLGQFFDSTESAALTLRGWLASSSYRAFLLGIIELRAGALGAATLRAGANMADVMLDGDARGEGFEAAHA